jgi:hypothetical protein
MPIGSCRAPGKVGRAYHHDHGSEIECRAILSPAFAWSVRLLREPLVSATLYAASGRSMLDPEAKLKKYWELGLLEARDEIDDHGGCHGGASGRLRVQERRPGV